MPQVFTFAFGDEDVEGGQVGDRSAAQDVDKSRAEEASDQAIAPYELHFDDMYSIPSNIQYNTVQLQSSNNGTITLPRRELFDIRAQLMAEDTNLDKVQAGLSADDILPRVYEGGFKTWECSVDLANYLLSHSSDLLNILDNPCAIVELGAGTALPSLLLFRLLLCSKPSPIPVRRSFWLADYNPSVLRLATIPNLLLTYALTANPVPLASGDLEMTHSFLTSFHEFLADRNIYIRTAAGNWGPRLAALMTPPSDPYPAETLILASETIYSPESTLAFTVCLDETMRRCEESGCRVRALIAAKKVYFGVGGGVDEFLGALKERGSEGNVVWETEGMGRGVGRCILEVTRGTQ